MSDESYEQRRRVAELLWGGFVRCPNTGRVIEFLPGDDKALCSCGRANPAWPTEHPGVHVVRLCDPATVDEYLTQKDGRR